LIIRPRCFFGRSRARETAVSGAAFVVMVVPAWYGVFAVHTMIHFWMTGRLLALFFALAPSLALLLANAPIAKFSRNMPPQKTL
jgi:hypothetical protein